MSAAGQPDPCIRLVGATEDLPALSHDLAALARGEGFGMLDRLVRDWTSGENRFGAPGELLLVAQLEGAAVGIAGLNRDPWAGSDAGRVRRLFVHPDHRGHQLGSRLLGRVVDAAFVYGFRELRLRTTTDRGSAFFEHNGFAAVDEPHATYVMRLR